MALSSQSAADLQAAHAARASELAAQRDTNVRALESKIAEVRAAATAEAQRAERELAAELRNRSMASRRTALQRLAPPIAEFLKEPTRAGAAAVAEAVRMLDRAFGHEIGVGLSPRLITFATAKVLATKHPNVIAWIARSELTAGLGASRTNAVECEGAVQKAIAADDARALVAALEDLADSIRKSAPSTATPTAEDRELFEARIVGDQTVLDRHAEAARAAAEAVARENGRRAAEHAAREQAAW